MRINLSKASSNKATRLPMAQYAPLARNLIETRLDKKGDISKAKIAELKTLLAGYRDGEPTAKGYSVYVKFLLGALTKISPELVDELVDQPKAQGSDYF